MASETKIEWCDSTHNPWIGCTKVSPACDHCYASVSTPVRTKGIVWGAGQPRQRTSEANWKLPVKWNRMDFGQCPGCGWRGTGILTCQADEHGSDRKCPICIRATPDGPEYISYLKPSRRRVFCASLADVFDNEAPIEWLVDLLDLIRRTPNLDWLLLTKRIGNWRRRLEDAVWYLSGPAGKVLDILGTRRAWIASWLLGTAVPTNVWLGATICNQQEADRDVPKLLQVPALVRFLSIEQMLEAIRVDDIAGPGGDGVMKPLCGLWHKRSELSGRMRPTSMSKIDWVICGGESGPHARPMHPDWVRNVYIPGMERRLRHAEKALDRFD